MKKRGDNENKKETDIILNNPTRAIKIVKLITEINLFLPENNHTIIAIQAIPVRVDRVPSLILFAIKAGQWFITFAGTIKAAKAVYKREIDSPTFNTTFIIEFRNIAE